MSELAGLLGTALGAEVRADEEWADCTVRGPDVVWQVPMPLTRTVRLGPALVLRPVDDLLFLTLDIRPTLRQRRIEAMNEEIDRLVGFWAGCRRAKVCEKRASPDQESAGDAEAGPELPDDLGPFATLDILSGRLLTAGDLDDKQREWMRRAVSNVPSFGRKIRLVPGIALALRDLDGGTTEVVRRGADGSNLGKETVPVRHYTSLHYPG